MLAGIMEQAELTHVCVSLWDFVTGRGKPLYRVEGERHRDGSYINGYRNDIETWETEAGDRRLIAEHIRWQTFSLGADIEGTRRVLKIARDGEDVFVAVEEGARIQKNFGPGETYMGEVCGEALPWRIVTGTIEEAQGGESQCEP